MPDLDPLDKHMVLELVGQYLDPLGVLFCYEHDWVAEDADSCMFADLHSPCVVKDAWVIEPPDAT